MALEPNAVEIMLEFATMLIDHGHDIERARDLVWAARTQPLATAEQREQAGNLCAWAGWCDTPPP